MSANVESMPRASGPLITSFMTGKSRVPKLALGLSATVEIRRRTRQAARCRHGLSGNEIRGAIMGARPRQEGTAKRQREYIERDSRQGDKADGVGPRATQGCFMDRSWRGLINFGF